MVDILITHAAKIVVGIEGDIRIEPTLTQVNGTLRLSSRQQFALEGIDLYRTVGTVGHGDPFAEDRQMVVQLVMNLYLHLFQIGPAVGSFSCGSGRQIAQQTERLNP